MSIFNFRNKTKKSQPVKNSSEEAEKKESKEERKGINEEKTVDDSSGHLKSVATQVILRPRITEKATAAQEANVYVFEIFPETTKNQVFRAVREIYKVEPKRVNIVKNPPKAVFVRGKRGVKKGVKKAYVYLKKGERIEIV